MGVKKVLFWPALGISQDGQAARQFVPKGCTIKKADKPCDANCTLELMVFIYDWIETAANPTYPNSDLHMLCRKPAQATWSTKMDHREIVLNVSDPLANLHYAYPDTKLVGYRVTSHDFCCEIPKMKLGANNALK